MEDKKLVGEVNSHSGELVNEAFVGGQTFQEHINNVLNGVCPLCGSKEGFEDFVDSNRKGKAAGTYCKSCNMQVVY
jgi:uncharacterized protein (DUF983 family)